MSYEEKPLLLFQKLKEANQNPVFTLRHIKDIESPVSLALAKQAQRREKKLANSSQKQPNTGDSKDAATTATVSQPRKVPPNAGRVEKASGFCIAIYPYMSEGGDDLDVGVGDTFIIVGKVYFSLSHTDQIQTNSYLEPVFFFSFSSLVEGMVGRESGQGTRDADQ